MKQAKLPENKENPKISVIVPIYKVEKYLEQCIESIIHQTYQKLEIILVDDGSPDKCPEICDDYAKKDKRIRVIHKTNGGLGATYNTGLNAATGEYIGFVEPDDWIEPEMYEKLQEKSKEYPCDIIKCFYTSIFSSGKKVIEKNFSSSECNQVIMGRGKCFNLISKHVSHWSAIYKKSFLEKNKITFNETPGAVSQDFGFILRCYSYAETVYIIPNAYLNYRILMNENKRSLLDLNILKECEITCKDLLADKSICSDIWERIYKRLCLRFVFLNIKTFSLSDVNSVKRLLKNIESKQTYQYFTTEEKKKVRHFLNQKLLMKISTGNKRQTYLFGFPYNVKTILANKVKHKHFFGLFKTVKNKDGKKIYSILGIPVLKKIKNNNKKEYRLFGVTLYKTKKRKIENKLNIIQTQLANIGLQLSNLKVFIEAQSLHNNTFARYKRFLEGKEVVLVCTGPSAQYFKGIKDAVYVGVNGAIYLSNVALDYLFVQDYTIHQSGNEKLNIDAVNYKGHSCKKFFGIIPDERLKTLFPQIERIPQQFSDNKEIVQYLLEDIQRHNIAYDLSREPLGDFHGTVFSALQFILYTNPKRLYLVGWDCGEGYVYGKAQVMGSAHYQINILQKYFVPYIKTYYPDLEIISINPVGLKGIFKDVYTKDYVKEHPEIETVHTLD